MLHPGSSRDKVAIGQKNRVISRLGSRRKLLKLTFYRPVAVVKVGQSSIGVRSPPNIGNHSANHALTQKSTSHFDDFNPIFRIPQPVLTTKPVTQRLYCWQKNLKLHLPCGSENNNYGFYVTLTERPTGTKGRLTRIQTERLANNNRDTSPIWKKDEIVSTWSHSQNYPQNLNAKESASCQCKDICANIRAKSTELTDSAQMPGRLASDSFQCQPSYTNDMGQFGHSSWFGANDSSSLIKVPLGTNPAKPYRKRGSLIEALNNAIELPPIPRIDEQLELGKNQNSTFSNCNHTASCSATQSTPGVENLRPNSCEIPGEKGKKNILRKLFRNPSKGRQEEPFLRKYHTMATLNFENEQNSSINKGNSLPGTPVRRQQIMKAEQSHVVVERIYCVRQVLQKVTEEYYAYGGSDETGFFPTDRLQPQALSFRAINRQIPERSSAFVRRASQHSSLYNATNGLRRDRSYGFVPSELDLPPRLMRPKTGKRGSMRRSKSQPMASPIDHEPTEEIGGFAEIAIPNGHHKVDFFVTPSESSSNATSSQQSHGPSYRSSVHSTSSSMTTSSLGSSENQEDTNCNQNGVVVLAEALWDHVTIQPDELKFSLGDVIQVCDWAHPELWFGTLKDRSGWFPASYVRLLANQPVKKESTSSEDSNTICVDSDQPIVPERSKRHRARIVQEILRTENDYFVLLRHLVQGFLNQARRRPELFTDDQLLVIFGNLEEIFRLHQLFLVDLETDFNKENPGASCIGHCFLRHHDSFEIYADYCNNRPLSCGELVNLSQEPRYHQFFEACRLLCGLPKLALEGFLLTPVQRICKYPLQLAELVKATPSSHADYAACTEALETMRRVALRINDSKKRLESLQKIAVWQKSVDGWTGKDLLEESSILYHSGEVQCRCVISGQLQWTKDYVAYLFDRTLVLCKKDLLKRNQLMLRHRVATDEAQFEMIDRKDTVSGISVKHGWKMTLSSLDIYYIFVCRSRKHKHQWEQVIERLNKEKPTSRPPGSEEKRIALAALKPTLSISPPRLLKQKSFQYPLPSDCSPGRKLPNK